jgi:hypothetical protein
METKGLKVLQNVKTRLINMLASLKKVGKKYRTLIAKMVIYNGIVKVAKANLLNLCDVGRILSLPYVFPLMKFVQARDVFVCDYIVTIKFAKLKCTKCTMTPPLHSSLRTFLSLQMWLQTHLLGLFKIESLT